MTDDQFNQQQDPSYSNKNGAQSGQTHTGSLQKEQESLPSAAADFSELELPAETSIEPEPQVSENAQAGSLPAAQQTQTSHAGSQVQPGQTQAQPAKSGHMQHVLTKEQAQQIVKGQLMFKNSTDPMLWLAFLLLRHYQLLEKENNSK